MPGDIVVCVKQVPHPDYLSKIALDLTRGTLAREGVPAIINPVDRNALEAALKIREGSTGRVIVLTMGPPQARKALEDALAMGADAAVHLCDRALAGADTLATARALAYGIKKLENVSLVLCGDATIDSGTGQVAAQLAELLGFPCVVNAEEIIIEDEQGLQVKRIWEYGHIKVRTKLPAVIAVTRNINQPRLPNVLGIMEATRKEIKEWCAADIGADSSNVGLAGSPTCFWQMSEFHAQRQGEILQGSAEEVVTAAVARLVKLEVL
jgi:electron transfer flavoprotein beta subunit